jgi:hypothetical protein
MQSRKSLGDWKVMKRWREVRRASHPKEHLKL